MNSHESRSPRSTFSMAILGNFFTLRMHFAYEYKSKQHIFRVATSTDWALYFWGVDMVSSWYSNVMCQGVHLPLADFLLDSQQMSYTPVN